MAQKKFFQPPKTGNEYATYLMQMYAGVEPEIPSSWKKVPFAQHPTYVTPQGEVYSHHSRRPLRKSAISCWHKYKGKEACVSIKFIKNKHKVSHQYSLSRLFFFCFIYPSILNKELENMTILDFVNMPSITFKDGDSSNFRISNFVFIEHSTDEIQRLYKKTRPAYYKYFKARPKLKNLVK